MVSTKRRRRRSGTPIIIVLAVLLLLVVTFGVIFIKFNNSRLLVGNWNRKVDLSNEMKDYIEAYLNDATLGTEVDVSTYVSKTSVKITLAIKNDGTFETLVDEESYNEALNTARLALKGALSELIAKRLEVSYIETDKDIQELAKEAIGMDLDSYIESYGPQLLPSIDSLEEKYGYKGFYKSDKDYIYFTDMLNLPFNGESSNEYMISDNTLVINFTDGAYVYTRADEGGIKSIGLTDLFGED